VSSFKSLDFDCINNLGYPIAEIGCDGEVIITKTPGTDGIVTTDTCKEQLLYEIQGLYYLNSDVTAVIDKVEFTQVGKERVKLSGITGQPPPRTTKVGITAFGGYTAELHWSLIGLDIPEKVKMAEIQMKHRYGPEGLKKFLQWTLTSYGSVPSDPRNYNSATIDLRLVAQAKEKADLSWESFAKPALEIVMQSWPAATTTPDKRQAEPQLVSSIMQNTGPLKTDTVAVSRVLSYSHTATYTVCSLLKCAHPNNRSAASRQDGRATFPTAIVPTYKSSIARLLRRYGACSTWTCCPSTSR
jgi:hypothetical protein